VHTLLFVEDDPAIRVALRLALEDEGYVVVEAEDGLTGMRLFAEQAIDLVLLDLRLPDISGFEVCRQLRQTSIVPIIMVTAQTDTHDLVAGLEAGADDYVTKPVVVVLSRDQLLERVWGYEYLGDSRLVDAHIRRLRVKIEKQPDDPKIICTARGMGYRLIPR